MKTSHSAHVVQDYSTVRVSIVQHILINLARLTHSWKCLLRGESKKDEIREALITEKVRFYSHDHQIERLIIKIELFFYSVC